MKKRIYRVTVEQTLYVLADTAMSAELWATYNGNEDTSPPNTHAVALTICNDPGVLNSLPWCADGADDGDEEKTVGEWLKGGTR